MSAAKKEWDSMWDGIIGLELKAHQAWYARGRVGEGRMVLVDENLQGACVAALKGVHFTRCDLSGAVLGSSFMDDAEMIDCKFFDARMVWSSWKRAVLIGCDFAESLIGGASFTDAVITECDWHKTYLEQSLWRRARVEGSSFVGANLDGAIWSQATLRQCNFAGATLRNRSGTGDHHIGSCAEAHFSDCDFRGANLTGLRLNNTTFERCKFHGIIGAPVLEGPVTLIDADFSAAADGSDVRSQADVLALWRTT